MSRQRTHRFVSTAMAFGLVCLSGCERLGKENEPPDGRAKRPAAPKQQFLADPTKGPIRCVGHTGPLTAAAVTPDGKLAFSSGTDLTLRVWDTRTGAEIRKLPTFYPSKEWLSPWNLCVSPDGKILAASVPGQKVRFWEVSTGKDLTERYSIPNGRWIAFSPDGARLALMNNDDGCVQVWELATHRNIVRLPRRGDDASGSCVTFSPDGKQLAIGYNLGKNEEERDERQPKITIWTLDEGKQVFAAGSTFRRVNALVFSPDGKHLAAAGECDSEAGIGAVFIWNVATRRLLHTLPVDRGCATFCLEFAPKGGYLVSGGDEPTIKFWDLSTGELIQALPGHKDQVSSLALSKDGSTLVLASDKMIDLWRLK